MEIREISDKNIWENFFQTREDKTFLQSWSWGEVQKKLGNKIWRLGVFAEPSSSHASAKASAFDGDKLFLVVLAVKVVAKRGKFLLLQHCLGMPEILLSKLKEIAKQEGCSFVRAVPLLPRSDENVKLFKDLGFRKSPMHASAYEATLKLDITGPENALLSNMRKTTRYLIKQAQKLGIEVVRSGKMEDTELYNELAKEAAKRQHFVPFAPKLVKAEFEAFAKDGQALLFFGKYKGEAVASALIIFWSGIGFYHQAAFDPKYHKIPITYFLQWEAIKEAKKRGCKLYDFWGYVDPKKYPQHPWAGPSFFKMGFGGKVYEYVRTQDYPFSQKYWLTWAFEKFRKTKRGL